MGDKRTDIESSNVNSTVAVRQPNTLIKNNTSFPLLSTTYLEKLYNEAYDTEGRAKNKMAGVLKYYQYLLPKAMADPEFGIGARGNSRGFIINHPMGKGKSILAIATAMSMWDMRKPVLLVEKSQQSQFKDDIRKLIGMLNTDMTKDELEHAQELAVSRFKIVTSNAHNMADQVTRSQPHAGSRGAQRDRALIGTDSLDDKLLIVDEAHDLFRAIINSNDDETNARRLYNMIMDARNLRILFLTGTFPAKDPFEIVPCFNMLAGTELLPSNYETFYEFYIDKVQGKIKNRGKLSNRLLGMISYAPYTSARDTATSEPRADGGFPEQLPTIIERVEMAPEQYRQYLGARDRENAEKGGGRYFGNASSLVQLHNLALPSAGRKSASSYYVKSRSLSNYAAPREYSKKTLNELPDDAFTADTSPKIIKMIENIEKSKGPAVVYSQFVDIGGLGVIERFLLLKGYKRWRPPSMPRGGAEDDAPNGAPDDAPDDAPDNAPNGAPDNAPNGALDGAPDDAPDDVPDDAPDDAPVTYFAVISGKVPVKERASIQKRFNEIGNLRGAFIRALLVSRTGAQGLNLLYGRQTHILEPYWNKSREEQFNARVVRLGSHDALPREERDVQPYLYIGIANNYVYEGIPDGEKKEKATIDEMFNDRALVVAKLINEMRILGKEVCLECSFYGMDSCRVCIPTNVKLYENDPGKDLHISYDPCQPMKETEEHVEEVTVDGEQYYYNKDATSPLGYTVYKFSEKLDGFTAIDYSDPIVMKVIEVVRGVAARPPNE